MPQQTLNTIASLALLASAVSAVVVAADILMGRRQKMTIMNVVWPITALYFGPVGLWAYWVMGRSSAAREHAGGSPSHRQGHDGPGSKKSFWQTVFVATSHCGAGCTLGDVIGETAIFSLGIVLFGSKLGTAYLIDFVLAYAFGIVFQYFTIAPMRNLGLAEGLKAAVKADTISLIAFQMGMYAVMALNQSVLFDRPPEPNTAAYWFLMQIAMIAGFATSYPANWWLVKSGIKEAM
jgi:hypothetical protein